MSTQYSDRHLQTRNTEVAAPIRPATTAPTADEGSQKVVVARHGLKSSTRMGLDPKRMGKTIPRERIRDGDQWTDAARKFNFG